MVVQTEARPVSGIRDAGVARHQPRTPPLRGATSVGEEQVIPEFDCKDEGALRAHVESFAAEIGFPQFGFVAQMRARGGDGRADVRVLSNNPREWSLEIASAVSEGRPHNLVRHASLHLPAFGWSTQGHLAGHTILDDLARAQVRSNNARGFQSGILCPVAAPEIEWGALAFYSRYPVNFHSLQSCLQRCCLYASHFSFWYMQRVCRAGRDPVPQLTRREAECLTWAGQGKTSSEIGTILGISDRTVEGYIASACEKLDARGRQAAIAKAMDLQLIGGRNSLLAEFSRQRDRAVLTPSEESPDQQR
jgi:DNA-binding CsgD family transcriptional regulator